MTDKVQYEKTLLNSCVDRFSHYMPLFDTNHLFSLLVFYSYILYNGIDGYIVYEGETDEYKRAPAVCKSEAGYLI